jgi:hypothetical protein
MNSTFKVFSKIAIGNIFHDDQLLTTILKEPMKPYQIQVFNAPQCLNFVPELMTHMLVIHILKWKGTNVALEQSPSMQTERKKLGQTFLARLTATRVPSLSWPLYTVPEPPCPIFRFGEKFFVAFWISGSENCLSPGISLSEEFLTGPYNPLADLLLAKVLPLVVPRELADCETVNT